MPNILSFRTPCVRGFLVFGMSNAKYLAFDTLDAEHSHQVCYAKCLFTTSKPNLSILAHHFTIRYILDILF